MKDRKSIVILYTKGLYDTNAIQLANTIRSIGADCHVIEVADDKYTNFGKGKLARSSYKFSIRNCRWAYSLFSNATAKKKAPHKGLKNIKADPATRTGVGKFAYDLTCRYYKVKNILRRYEPEIVLCFTGSALKSAIKANEQLRMYTTKIYACITDFGLDMRFFNRRAAGYIVENEDVMNQLVANGIEEEKIYVTSLLSDKTSCYDKDEIKRQIGINNDKPNVLLVGGRYGASIIKNVLSYLVNYTDNFNLITLTGGSKTIVNVAKHITNGASDGVYLIDEIDDISKVYSLADIVVATPTTCICAEALSCDKQLIVLKPTGSVEASNAKYLISHAYALDGANKDKLLVALSSLILGKSDLATMSKFIENGSIEKVAKYLLTMADDIFEEKKILLAEKKLDDAKDIDDYVIDDVTDVDVKEIESIRDASVDKEYND